MFALCFGFVRWRVLVLRARPGDRAVDLCCGSGDIALLLSEKVGPSGQVRGRRFLAHTGKGAARRFMMKVYIVLRPMFPSGRRAGVAMPVLARRGV